MNQKIAIFVYLYPFVWGFAILFLTKIGLVTKRGYVYPIYFEDLLGCESWDGNMHAEIYTIPYALIIKYYE